MTSLRDWQVRAPVRADRTGTFEDPRVGESSGVAASPAHPGVFWTVNDSGNDPVLFATDTLGAFDVKAHVDGGGMSGQAGAMRMAIARTLVLADALHRPKLRTGGLLTRDSRAVERKKPGRPGARKRFQFSKR